MTSLTLEEIVDCFGEQSVIWDGISSTIMTIENTKLILYINDTSPPNAPLERIKRIADLSKQRLDGWFK
jgi:hypothetical protein